MSRGLGARDIGKVVYVDKNIERAFLILVLFRRYWMLAWPYIYLYPAEAGGRKPTRLERRLQRSNPIQLKA